MANYRMLFQPKYGEMAPEVRLPAPENFDLTNPTTARKKLIAEIYAGIVAEVKETACYEAICAVPTTDLRVTVRDGAEIPVRIYHPLGEGPHKVLYFIHGGGFISNDLNVYDYVNRYLCRYSNAVIFSVAYRLAPEYRCPTGREDCYDVMQWVAAHAAEYGGDPATLSVCGDSAGGNLTAAMALLSRDRKGPKITKQMMVFPLTTFVLDAPTCSMERYGKGDYFLKMDGKDSGLTDIYFADPADARDPYNSPLLAEDLKELPPAYFYSAECDPLLDQGLMFAAKLQDAGVPVEYHVYEGMIHGFLSRTLQKSYACMDQICADLHA